MHSERPPPRWTPGNTNSVHTVATRGRRWILAPGPPGQVNSAMVAGGGERGGGGYLVSDWERKKKKKTRSQHLLHGLDKTMKTESNSRPSRKDSAPSSGQKENLWNLSLVASG